MPATLGSMARRRGPDAARQRVNTTSATARQAPETSHWRAVFSASARSSFGVSSRKLPGSS